jgi:hypothetical protein
VTTGTYSDHCAVQIVTTGGTYSDHCAVHIVTTGLWRVKMSFSVGGCVQATQIRQKHK